MGNLNQIVNTTTVADNRIVQSPSVHARIGADFDIVADNHAANLRNTFMLAGNHQETETVRTDSGAVVNKAVIAHNRIGNACIGTDAAVVAYLTAAIDNRSGFQNAVVADFDVFTDNHMVGNAAVLPDNCRRMNPCRRSDIGTRLILGIQAGIKFKKSQFRIGAYQDNNVFGHELCQLRRRHTGLGLDFGALGLCFFVIEKTNFAGAGPLHRIDVVNRHAGLFRILQFGLAYLGHLLQRKRSVIDKKTGVNHYPAP